MEFSYIRDYLHVFCLANDADYQPLICLSKAG